MSQNHIQKTAIVTGAGGVLGQHFCEALLESHFQVILLGRTLSKLEVAAEKLEQKYLNQTFCVQGDVTSAKSIELASQKIQSRFDSIDVLLNAAGGNMPGATSSKEIFEKNDSDFDGTFFGMSTEDFKKVIDLNFNGTLIPSQIFGALMAQKKSGTIVNISSMSAQLPLTKVAGYSASKSAIDNFTRWLAVHLAPKNIRVNAIAPGFFVSEQNKALLYESDEKTLTSRGNKIIGQTPMNRFGKPEELKGILKFLVSPEASFVTGTIIPVDGGFSAFSGV